MRVLERFQPNTREPAEAGEGPAGAGWMDKAPAVTTSIARSAGLGKVAARLAGILAQYMGVF